MRSQHSMVAAAIVSFIEASVDKDFNVERQMFKVVSEQQGCC